MKLFETQKSAGLVAVLSILSMILFTACGGSSATSSVNDPGASNNGPPNFDTTSEVPVSTGPGASTTAVEVIGPSETTLNELGEAFSTVELPATCIAATIPGTVHVAEVKATDDLWAVAGFKPGPYCTVIFDGKLSDPYKYGVFDTIPSPPAAVFKKHLLGRGT